MCVVGRESERAAGWALHIADRRSGDTRRLGARFSSRGSRSHAQVGHRINAHLVEGGEIVVADYLPGRGMVISARKENPVRVWGWQTHEANIAEENEDKLDR